MPQPISCDGCGRSFSAPKYRRSHLSQTTDPQCQAERPPLLACHYPDSSPPTSPRRSPACPSPPIPPSFDSPYNTLTQQPPEPDDEDDSDRTSTVSDDSEQNLGRESDENTDNDEHGRFLSSDEVSKLQDAMWREVHIEEYPGTNAGAIHYCGIPTMKEFENTLGGPSSNPYAPFSSQTDWELAKWAKSRGPSSSAFTEL
jgi:uncharacterized protein RhaS with RHS repeats